MEELTLKQVAIRTGEKLGTVQDAAKKHRGGSRTPRALVCRLKGYPNGPVILVTEEEADRWHNAKAGLTCDCCNIDRSDLERDLVHCNGQWLCSECKLRMGK